MGELGGQMGVRVWVYVYGCTYMGGWVGGWVRASLLGGALEVRRGMGECGRALLGNVRLQRRGWMPTRLGKCGGGCVYVGVGVLVGLAITICIRCIHGIIGREITKYTVIYGEYIRFWPTLRTCGKANHKASLTGESVF